MSQPRASAPSTPRRHTHPLTPVIQAFGSLTFLLVAAVFSFQGLGQVAKSLGLVWALALVVLVVVAFLGLIGGLSYWAWRRTEFFFDDSGDFRLDSGVISRNERRVTLSRLQSVDVVRPLLGRIFGLAQVRIEVAGAGDSRVVVSYLSDVDAVALRAEIIARAAGVRHDAGEAPEAVLASVPTGDLIVSLLLRSETVALFLLTLLIVGTVVIAEGAVGLLAVLVTGGLPLLAVFGEFSRFFGFTVADSPDGVRLRFGLLKSESQTVPPGRVQAVEFVEPLLWRRKGWVRVRLNVAGQQVSGQDGSTAERVLLPVAPHDVARQIVARVMPGVSFDDLVFQSAPRRSRRRAWIQWRNLAVAASEEVFVTRRGFFTRRTSVIPHARTQSVRVTQGPWQRVLDLASVHVDSTPGPVRITGLHQDAAQARRIAEAQLVRATAARSSGPRERWLSPDGRPADLQHPDTQS